MSIDNAITLLDPFDLYVRDPYRKAVAIDGAGRIDPNRPSPRDKRMWIAQERRNELRAALAKTKRIPAPGAAWLSEAKGLLSRRFDTAVDPSQEAADAKSAALSAVDALDAALGQKRRPDPRKAKAIAALESAIAELDDRIDYLETLPDRFSEFAAAYVASREAESAAKKTLEGMSPDDLLASFDAADRGGIDPQRALLVAQAKVRDVMRRGKEWIDRFATLHPGRPSSAVLPELDALARGEATDSPLTIAFEKRADVR